jgi:uncharacterized protein (DUF885 family)
LAFKQNLLPVRQLASLAVEFPLLASVNGIHPFKTVGDYENLLKRIAASRIWIDTAIGNMRAAIEVKIVQPRSVIEQTLPQLEAIPGHHFQIFLQRERNRMPLQILEAKTDRWIDSKRR